MYYASVCRQGRKVYFADIVRDEFVPPSPGVETRIFVREEEAIAWISSHAKAGNIGVRIQNEKRDSDGSLISGEYLPGKRVEPLQDEIDYWAWKHIDSGKGSSSLEIIDTCNEIMDSGMYISYLELEDAILDQLEQE